MSQHNWSSLYVYYHLKLAARYIAENLVFRDKIEIFSFLISFFETRSRFLLSLSRFSRRDRDFFFPYLGFRDVSRQNLEQNLTRFFEIEISRWALPCSSPLFVLLLLLITLLPLLLLLLLLLVLMVMYFNLSQNWRSKRSWRGDSVSVSNLVSFAKLFHQRIAIEERNPLDTDHPRRGHLW